MTSEAYRPVAAATLCTALGIVGMVMSGAAARPDTPPITPESLTVEQAREVCRESELEINSFEGEVPEEMMRENGERETECLERECERELAQSPPEN